MPRDRLVPRERSEAVCSKTKHLSELIPGMSYCIDCLERKIGAKYTLSNLHPKSVALLSVLSFTQYRGFSKIRYAWVRLAKEHNLGSASDDDLLLGLHTLMRVYGLVKDRKVKGARKGYVAPDNYCYQQEWIRLRVPKVRF